MSTMEVWRRVAIRQVLELARELGETELTLQETLRQLDDGALQLVKMGLLVHQRDQLRDARARLAESTEERVRPRNP